MGFSNDSIYRFAAGLSPKAPSWFLTKSNARVTLLTRLMMLTGPPLPFTSHRLVLNSFVMAVESIPVSSMSRR